MLRFFKKTYAFGVKLSPGLHGENEFVLNVQDRMGTETSNVGLPAKAAGAAASRLAGVANDAAEAEAYTDAAQNTGHADGDDATMIVMMIRASVRCVECESVKTTKSETLNPEP